jgi:hypothetical protein
MEFFSHVCTQSLPNQSTSLYVFICNMFWAFRKGISAARHGKRVNNGRNLKPYYAMQWNGIRCCSCRRLFACHGTQLVCGEDERPHGCFLPLFFSFHFCFLGSVPSSKFCSSFCAHFFPPPFSCLDGCIPLSWHPPSSDLTLPASDALEKRRG